MLKPKSPKPERPSWVSEEYLADRVREKPARLLFEALVYIGDQLGAVVDAIHWQGPREKRPVSP